MDNFVINADDTVSVSFDDPAPYVNVTVAQPQAWGVVTIEGPQGATGPSGPSYEGVAWWYGEGDPGTILGSKPGDYYLDTASGQIFVLGG